jgi:hypothetical protein
MVMMEKIYLVCIYTLVIFCGGCAVTEILTGDVSLFGLTMIAAGMALLVYTIRLMSKPERKPGLSRVSEN